jgi:hypothetical protein
MNKLKFLYVFLLFFQLNSFSQGFFNKYEIGISYTPFPNDGNLDYRGEEYIIWDHFLCMNTKIWINKRIGIGTEFLYMIINTEKEKPPYYLFSLGSNFRLYRDKNFEACTRVGFSYGDLIRLWGGDVLRLKSLNLLVGANIDYRVYHVFWLQFGYNGHISLKKIAERKDIISQPFIGLAVKF